MGKHFETRLAHVHGNLFAFLNIVIGFLLIQLPFKSGTTQRVSWLALLGMMMPLGILAEFLPGAPPIFVLIGGVCIVIAVTWLGLAAMRLDSHGDKRSLM